MIKKISRKLEKIFSESSLYFKIYAAPYHRVVKREIELTKKHGNLKPPLLNIGCGSMPFTTYYLARETDLEVVAVDQDSEMTDLAKKTIKKLGLENKITVINKKASEIDFKEYQAVYTALHLKNKKKVYNQFMETAPQGSRFLVREPRKTFKNHYEELNNNSVDLVKHRLVTFDRTCLYIKD
ncbi:methyltransferase domain-containing protein [Methanonatronarchaeum sp. AMET-Sl]|uniref:methyltransferase domain-containing protein n=1 Tax=Methanonatronarchaeum sp. AMET-Sl TaxID=3037654 RepID=UPI00244E1DED|nr:methyltransferase domain-containing protein [Methanonatronarchaeum sp. AMET-Sl]WGI18124.1 methyltransferase domain-containing protein [Methanonatronarchaeum sp. AMET-Sl]